MQPFVVGGDPLHDHDADRLIDEGPAAARFAGMRTDPAANRRNRHVVADRRQRIVMPALLDLLDVGGNIDVGRTAVDAGGRHLLLVNRRLRLLLAVDVGKEITAEMLDRVKDRQGRCHTERAFAVVEQVGKPLDGFEVLFLPLAADDPGEGIMHDHGAALAGRTLGTAVFLLHPLHVLGRHGDHIGLLVEQDNAVPAHEGADLALIEVRLRQFQID